jgi:4-hydroxy-tetrahydrodipicolinate reductase
MVKIGVNGALGRMGARILALAKDSKDLEIAGAFDAGGTKLSADALKSKGRGVLIDFSSPEGTLAAADAASQAGWALVVGTTGLDAKQSEALKKAAQAVPVVVSSNMSIGVNVVLALLAMASKKLPPDFKVEMSEAHHVHKKDAPSGTALMLAKEIAAARPMDFAALSKSIHVIREGEIIGDHSVSFAGPEETIEIKHHAKSRDIFAQGALTAAKFAAEKKPGLYSMRDVLGL